MTLRNRIGLCALWAASVVVTGAWAQTPAPLPPAPLAQAPTILSGSDLGFRVDRRNGSVPVGALVVRMNGQWVEVEFGVAMKRLTAK
jgi:hypothetical protein